MKKILLLCVAAALLALTVTPTSLVASGGNPTIPPATLVASGGDPTVPPTTLVATGGDPTVPPAPSLIA